MMLLKTSCLLKNEIDSISYTFLESSIVKAQDTFPIELEFKQFYFDGIVSKNQHIDAIKLKTTSKFQNRELFIFKKNDATPYLN